MVKKIIFIKIHVQATFVSIGFRFETKSPDIEKDILQSKKGSKISSLAKKRLFCKMIFTIYKKVCTQRKTI
jgi:hypothetical protein